MIYLTIFLWGVCTVMATCSLLILGLSGVRGYRGYLKYIRNGKIDAFEILSDKLSSENHPASLVVDMVLFLFFALILSALWPLIVLIAIICGVAWCNRLLYLWSKREERIIARLNGTNPYGR